MSGELITFLDEFWAKDTWNCSEWTFVFEADLVEEFWTFFGGFYFWKIRKNGFSE